MSDVKIQIKIWNLEFSGEGNSDRLEKQIDKILQKTPQLNQEQTEPAQHIPSQAISNNQITKWGNALWTLPTFLKEKNALDNRNLKFLATAAFLHLSGRHRVTRIDITTALKNASQKPIPSKDMSLVMQRVISKGYCAKDGKELYVTTEGYEHLGINL